MCNKIQITPYGSEEYITVRPGLLLQRAPSTCRANRLELNARLAASLDAPVLMVLDANSATGIDDLVNKALVSRNGLTEERAEVMGLIVNKVSPPDDTAGPYPLSSASSSSLHPAVSFLQSWSTWTAWSTRPWSPGTASRRSAPRSWVSS